MGLITQTNQAYYEGSDLGNYRYIPLNDIVNNFMFAYVGEGKIIERANKRDSRGVCWDEPNLKLENIPTV